MYCAAANVLLLLQARNNGEQEGHSWQRRIASLSGHLTGALSNAFSTAGSAASQVGPRSDSRPPSPSLVSISVFADLGDKTLSSEVGYGSEPLWHAANDLESKALICAPADMQTAMVLMNCRDN